MLNGALTYNNLSVRLFDPNIKPNLRQSAAELTLASAGQKAVLRGNVTEKPP